MSSMAWVSNDQTKVESTVGGGMVDRFRQRVHCRFCGGKQCKHEDWTRAENRKNTHVAIKGLHSNWVENWAIASQRPASVLFAKYDIIPQFQQCNLKAVFNLQETGEHPFCGPQGHLFPQSGFSYVPEIDLMPHGVSHYSFPWPDMGTPNFDIVLRTVQVMCDHVSKGERFLVHCHAGLGRTGLMIACWIMYQFGYDAHETVERVRRQRPGSIQTSNQLKFVHDFHKYLLALREVFAEGESIDQHLERQNAYLHGQEARALRYVPKLCHSTLIRMLDMVDTEFSDMGTTHRGSEICSLLIDGVRRRKAGTRLKPSLAGKLKALRQSLEGGHWGAIKKVTSPALLVEVLLDFLSCLSAPIVPTLAIEEAMKQFSSKGYSEMDPKVLRNSVHPHPPAAKKVVEPLAVDLEVSKRTMGVGSPVYSPHSSTSRSSRKLPPLGSKVGSEASPRHNSGVALSVLTRNMNIYSSDEDISPTTISAVTPSRRQEALLSRVSHKLWAAQRSSEQLASVALKQNLASAPYHTVGVILSSIRLMSWDLPQQRQGEILRAILEVLTQTSLNDDEVAFFSTAAKEWGDAYFTRESARETTENGNGGERIASMYSEWLSRLYSHHSEVGKCPYNCGISTPEGGMPGQDHDAYVIPTALCASVAGSTGASAVASSSPNDSINPPPPPPSIKCDTPAHARPSLSPLHAQAVLAPESCTSPQITRRGSRTLGVEQPMHLVSVGDSETAGLSSVLQDVRENLDTPEVESVTQQENRDREGVEKDKVE